MFVHKKPPPKNKNKNFSQTNLEFTDDQWNKGLYHNLRTHAYM